MYSFYFQIFNKIEIFLKKFSIIKVHPNLIWIKFKEKNPKRDDFQRLYTCLYG